MLATNLASYIRYQGLRPGCLYLKSDPSVLSSLDCRSLHAMLRNTSTRLLPLEAAQSLFFLLPLASSTDNQVGTVYNIWDWIPWPCGASLYLLSSARALAMMFESIHRLVSALSVIHFTCALKESRLPSINASDSLRFSRYYIEIFG